MKDTHTFLRHPLPLYNMRRLHQVVGDPRLPGAFGYVGVKVVSDRAAIGAGSVIFREPRIETMTSPTSHSLQVDVDEHCEIEGEGRFCVHSTNPTCYVRLVENAIEIVALGDILEPGTDISIDYNATEWELDVPFDDCSSGEECRGFKHLTQDRRLQLRDRGILPSHILTLWQTLE